MREARSKLIAARPRTADKDKCVIIRALELRTCKDKKIKDKSAIRINILNASVIKVLSVSTF